MSFPLILTVVGARPQFIKAAVVSRALQRMRYAGETTLQEQLIHTGQHYDDNMSGAFFREMEIPEPALHLGLSASHHGAATGAMLSALEDVFMRRRPDAVLVYGDTNSTLAGALAAAKLHIPVAHVEAGLRSFNKCMPEEINRILTDHMSQWLFCPSANAAKHLNQENITEGVHITGDVMYDAVLHYGKRAAHEAPQHPYAIATLHRAENTDDKERLSELLEGLSRCPLPILLPLHPRTKKQLRVFGFSLPDKVQVLPPASYLQMIALVANAQFVLTDSGGLQKEAFFLGRPCLTLRDETEWIELIESGVNRLVGADTQRIEAGYSWAMNPLPEMEHSPYGNGKAAEALSSVLHQELCP